MSDLARRLTTTDAVVIGAGSMLGAGVFAVLGPAAAAAGSGLLLALGIAGLLAFANATSSADLAAQWPESGGAYVYGTRALGAFWGHLAGWAFVVGKIASCAAMAMTLGTYAWPDQARGVAVAAVVVLTGVNLGGITRTAALTRALLVCVLAALAVTVVGMSAGGLDASHLMPVGTSPRGVLQAAGLLFFAFAGYARIATLGEEVIDPARTIRRAVPLALAGVFVIYVIVATTALAAVGPDALAMSAAPLAEAVAAGPLDALAPAVRIGAGVASAGVLLALIAGVSRTALAMARDGHLPAPLARISGRTAVPHVAEVAVAVVVIGIIGIGDLRDAIGFSSFAVLTYYAVANAAALRLDTQGRWPRWLRVVGLSGCVVVAASLPPDAVAAGVVVLALGAGAYLITRQRTRTGA